jgi:AraC-like DNA-binding protein
MQLLAHRYGRFDRRHRIGPARWSHHDLLWFHEGTAELRFEGSPPIVLQAPDGVLIAPGTAFEGEVIGEAARASICHFVWTADDGPAPAAPWVRCETAIRPEVQSAIRLALRLAEDRPGALPRRERLLRSILDAFDGPNGVATRTRADPLPADLLLADPLLADTWAWVADNLARIRTLADVAAYAGLSDSQFRSRHRACHAASAGVHLRELRLLKGEQLLVGTRSSVAGIARAVGYAHPETFTAFFVSRYGRPPRAYRKAFARFA